MTALQVIERLRESILQVRQELENIDGMCDELDYPLEILDAAIETADAALNQALGQRGDDGEATIHDAKPRAVPSSGPNGNGQDLSNGR